KLVVTCLSSGGVYPRPERESLRDKPEKEVQADPHQREIYEYGKYARNIDRRLPLNDQAAEAHRRSNELADDRTHHGKDDADLESREQMRQHGRQPCLEEHGKQRRTERAHQQESPLIHGSHAGDDIHQNWEQRNQGGGNNLRLETIAKPDQKK